jgi:hypothetical protein
MTDLEILPAWAGKRHTGRPEQRATGPAATTVDAIPPRPHQATGPEAGSLSAPASIDTAPPSGPVTAEVPAVGPGDRAATASEPGFDTSVDAAFLYRTDAGQEAVPPPVPEIRPPGPAETADRQIPASSPRPFAVDPDPRSGGVGLLVKTLAIFLVLGALAAALGYLGGRLITENRADAGESPAPTGTLSASPVEREVSPSGQPLLISLDQHQLTVTGTLADQATADAIAEASEVAFGSSTALNLTVDPGIASPPWVDGLPIVIHGFASLIDGSVTIWADSVVLVAEAPNRRSLNRLTDALAPELGFPPLDDGAAEVTTDQAPTVTAVASDGVLTLTGTVPDDEIKEAIVAAGIELYDEIDVADEVEVDSSVFAVPELLRFPEDLAMFATIGDFEIGIDRSGFHGVTDDGIAFAREAVMPDDYGLLQELPDLLLRTGEGIHLVGYASDARGDEAVELAQRRAEMVADRLTDAGVDPTMVVVGDAGAEIDDGREVVVVIGSSR